MGVFGVSVVSTGLIDKQFGLSVIALDNVYVVICDPSLSPVVATLTVTGGADIDGVYAGFSEYPLTSGTFSNINFEASAPGYITNSVISDTVEGGYTEVKIELVPDTVQFTCTTVFKNKFDITIAKPLADGYVEVKFSGSSPFDKANYFTSFEAILQGGTKYSSRVLDNDRRTQNPRANSLHRLGARAIRQERRRSGPQTPDSTVT